MRRIGIGAVGQSSMGEAGELLELPLIPMPLEGMETVRSLSIEFLLWFEELPDIEARLLADKRSHYKETLPGKNLETVLADVARGIPSTSPALERPPGPWTKEL